MSGVVLRRCPLCEELSFDPRTRKCDRPACGYDGTCTMCGGPVVEPPLTQFCSPECKFDAMAEVHAELMISDGGL